jgi:hypothetical protein
VRLVQNVVDESLRTIGVNATTSFLGFGLAKSSF